MKTTFKLHRHVFFKKFFQSLLFPLQKKTETFEGHGKKLINLSKLKDPLQQ